jgi:hypothetical protein
MIAVSVAWPGVAAATPVDAASTSAFIAAETRVETRAIALYGREKASADALVEHVRATCPGVIPGQVRSGTVAQRRVWVALLTEGSYELALAWVQPLRLTLEIGVAQVSRLHWTEPALNRAVKASVREARATLSLRPPDLCADARLARASGFEAIPRRTTTFLHDATLALPDSGPSAVALAKRMRHDLPASRSNALKHLETISARLDRLTAGNLAIWEHLMGALS